MALGTIFLVVGDSVWLDAGNCDAEAARLQRAAGHGVWISGPPKT